MLNALVLDCRLRFEERVEAMLNVRIDLTIIFEIFLIFR